MNQGIAARHLRDLHAARDAGRHDQTTPVELHRLISRLLDDHQRADPHHHDMCPLCQDASNTLDLLADEVPDDLTTNFEE